MILSLFLIFFQNIITFLSKNLFSTKCKMSLTSGNHEFDKKQGCTRMRNDVGTHSLISGSNLAQNLLM